MIESRAEIPSLRVPPASGAGDEVEAIYVLASPDPDPAGE
jgi:hypothetical protein